MVSFFECILINEVRLVDIFLQFHWLALQQFHVGRVMVSLQDVAGPLHTRPQILLEKEIAKLAKIGLVNFPECEEKTKTKFWKLGIETNRSKIAKMVAHGTIKVVFWLRTGSSWEPIEYSNHFKNQNTFHR